MALCALLFLCADEHAEHNNNNNENYEKDRRFLETT